MATLTPAPRLRGREQELQALGDAFGQVASGHPAVVIVEGEAGIGKTRLPAEGLDGARSHGLRSRRRPRLGWGSLTPTEQRVVALVAEGLSNPQIGERLFVSRRTVPTHLAHVSTKLGISSRTQLAADAARQAAPSRS